MNTVALIEALLIVLVILIIVAFIWYYSIGWSKFSYVSGNTVSWTSSTGKTEDLRFKNVKFSLNFPNGSVSSWDVSEVLNSMAVAYENNVGPSNNGTLMLRVISDGTATPSPLNPFSFIKSGLNDSQTVSDPTSQPWLNTIVSLTGEWRTL